ncbi:MAG: 50S ribosomal protein L11 methyltransferase [Lachnospiraceae bacterium]|nr:50S ribosomal protein L11 methyltransferase [Lachnospiraceae bacterium]
MKWNKYTIKTTTQAEDFVSSMLADLGIEGVQIEDNVPLSPEDKEKMYIDILPELPKDEGIAFVSFFLESEAEQEPLLVQVKEELEELRLFTEIGAGTIAKGETEDKDWINNWKQYFQSFTIEDILIKPTWEEGTDPGTYRCVIEIDPGTSFGTGKHETTRLCIQQIRKYLKPNDRLLDVGCGSGILSVAGLKLGAGEAVGIDVDPLCIEASRENIRVNHLPEEKGRFYQGNLIEDEALQEQIGGGYDIAAANILADIIIPLTPAIPACLKQGGIYITSGIIDFKETAVRAAIEAAGFTILETEHLGEWVSITARKD